MDGSSEALDAGPPPPAGAFGDLPEAGGGLGELTVVVVVGACGAASEEAVSELASGAAGEGAGEALGEAGGVGRLTDAPRGAAASTSRALPWAGVSVEPTNTPKPSSARSATAAAHGEGMGGSSAGLPIGASLALARVRNVKKLMRLGR
jgi:hypothetical protein